MFKGNMIGVVVTMALLGVMMGACGAVEISYKAKNAGNVSLGVYNTQGQLVRTLQNGKKTQPGTYAIEWDGKDDQGAACAAGKYELRGISSAIKADLQLVAGSPGNPPYFSADGKGGWNGHWGNPMGVAADTGGVYLSFSGEEGAGSQMKLDFDGNVQWKANLFQGDGNGIQLACASDGKHLYIAADNPVGDYGSFMRRAIVWRIETADGNYANWAGHGLPVGQPYESGPVPFWEFVKGDKAASPTVCGAKGGANARGLAVKAGKVYVSLYREDKIEVWDTESGKKLSEIAGISKPQGLAIDQSGNLFVASGAQILKVAADGKVTPAVTTGLVAPYGVALDAEGNFFVSDLSTSQQVKKFARDGKPLWTSGREGGRPYEGKYEPENFLFPVGLAAANGRVYVAEDGAPRRTVMLDAATGKLVKEWVGSIDVGAGIGIAPDEADPTHVYVLHFGQAYLRTWNAIVRYIIDYEKKTWKVDACWWGQGGHLWPGTQGGLSLRDSRIITVGGSDYYLRHFQGHTYLCSGAHHQHAIWRVDGYQLIPSASVGQMAICFPQDLSKGYTLDAKYNTITTAGDQRQFAWHDKNGDGLASADEVEFSDVLGKGVHYHGGWGGYFDQQMNCYLPDEPNNKVWKVPCLGVDAKGNPIYSWAKAEVVIPEKEAMMAEAPLIRAQPWLKDKTDKDGKSYNDQIYRKAVERIHLDPEGNIYGTTEIMGADKGIGWASSTLAVKVGKWNAKGERMWLVGKKAQGFSKPGEFYTGKGVDGVLKGFVFFTDENGQSRVYTDDGLYAGSVPSGDPSRGAAPGPDTLLIEYCGGRVFTHPKTGVDYLLMGDGAGLHFFKLDGLKAVERLKAPVILP